MLEGYAQFSEFITSDDPVVETRQGFALAECSGREVFSR
jgi:hypothetical protein